MKIKRSIAIPQPVNEWLETSARSQGISVSALLTHLLLNIIKREKKNGR